MLHPPLSYRIFRQYLASKGCQMCVMKGETQGKTLERNFPSFTNMHLQIDTPLGFCFCFSATTPRTQPADEGFRELEAGSRQLVHPRQRQRSAACLPRRCCALWHAYPVTPPASLPRAVLRGATAPCHSHYLSQVPLPSTSPPQSTTLNGSRIPESSLMKSDFFIWLSALSTTF